MKNTNRPPVFIIGMPRSGTKLLRTLLSQHSLVFIPEAESEFIPYFMRSYPSCAPFRSRSDVGRFVDEFKKSNFYSFMTKAGFYFDTDYFSDNLFDKSWSKTFEFILRYFSNSLELDNVIWGDKTPGYINQTDLLLDLFPDAKFIHIIRDPRDYCLSVHKTWGKSILRAAHRWNDSLETVDDSNRLLPTNYIELKYEELIRDSRDSLVRLCDYLSIEFEEGMLVLKKAPENYGSAKGEKKVVSDNSNKFHEGFTKQTVKHIEELCFDMMALKAYECCYATTSKKMSRTHLILNKVYDGIVYLPFALKDHNSFSALLYYIKRYRQSSWR